MAAARTRDRYRSMIDITDFMWVCALMSRRLVWVGVGGLVAVQCREGTHASSFPRSIPFMSNVRTLPLIEALPCELSALETWVCPLSLEPISVSVMLVSGARRG